MYDEMDAKGADLYASRLCERNRSHPFDIGDGLPEVVLTASIGVAVGSPRGAVDFAETLWSRADDALYEAKRANRNCVRMWSTVTRRSGEYTAISARMQSRGAVPFADL